ncbi:MAG: hypothetical protein IPH08_03710 [Rhodocyclaceae bacterium]|nr:hypothetical protein [Rhodocyclaceae bacterium]MBK6906259.1 hypothetical protein [Rhodocyclaceae bacterium]
MEAQVVQVIDPRQFDVFTDVALTAMAPDGRTAVFGIQLLSAEPTDSEVRPTGEARHDLSIGLTGKIIAVNEAAADMLTAMNIRGAGLLRVLR